MAGPGWLVRRATRTLRIGAGRQRRSGGGRRKVESWMGVGRGRKVERGGGRPGSEGEGREAVVVDRILPPQREGGGACHSVRACRACGCGGSSPSLRGGGRLLAGLSISAPNPTHACRPPTLRLGTPHRRGKAGGGWAGTLSAPCSISHANTCRCRRRRRVSESLRPASESLRPASESLRPASESLRPASQSNRPASESLRLASASRPLSALAQPPESAPSIRVSAAPIVCCPRGGAFLELFQAARWSGVLPYSSSSLTTALPRTSRSLAAVIHLISAHPHQLLRAESILLPHSLLCICCPYPQ